MKFLGLVGFLFVFCCSCLQKFSILDLLHVEFISECTEPILTNPFAAISVEEIVSHQLTILRYLCFSSARFITMACLSVLNLHISSSFLISFHLLSQYWFTIQGGIIRKGSLSVSFLFGNFFWASKDICFLANFQVLFLRQNIRMFVRFIAFVEYLQKGLTTYKASGNI